MRFLRNLRPCRGPFWAFPFLNVEFRKICYSCHFRYSVFLDSGFLEALLALVTFAIFAKFADLLKPFLTFSLSKCRILLNLLFLLVFVLAYIKETPWDTMTLEYQKSFPVLLKIVNRSNLVLKSFSHNIELSFLKLRPRPKKKKNKHFAPIFLPLYSQILSLESCRMLLGAGWNTKGKGSEPCVILSPQSGVLGAFVRVWFFQARSRCLGHFAISLNARISARQL